MHYFPIHQLYYKTNYSKLHCTLVQKRKNATLFEIRRIVSNSVVNAKSDTTIDTIQVNSGIVVLYSI